MLEVHWKIYAIILRQSKHLIKVLCARTLFKPWFPNSCCSSPPTFTNTWLFVSLSLHLFLSHFYLNSFTYWSLAGPNWKSFRFSFCVLKILSFGSISFAFWIKCFQKIQEPYCETFFVTLNFNWAACWSCSSSYHVIVENDTYIFLSFVLMTLILLPW